MNVRFILLLLLALLAGCERFRQTEPRAPIVKMEMPGAACHFAELRAFTDPNRATRRLILDTADCVERTINDAFRQVHGEKIDEISVDELRRLAQEKLINVPMESDTEWLFFAHFARLLHPQGRPAISRNVLLRFVVWARQKASLYVDLVRWSRLTPSSERTAAAFDARFGDTMIGAARSLVDFLSPGWHLSLAEALDLYHQACVYADKKWRVHFEPLPDQVEAGWILKSFLIPDPESRGLRGELTGSDLRPLLDLILRLLGHAPLTRLWGIDRLLPARLPSGLPEEWQMLAADAARYFASHRFTAIDTRLLQWSLQVLSRDNPLSDLVPDLVRISQRLSPEGQRHRGLHPISVLAFLRQAGSIARDLSAAAPVFGQCGYESHCAVRDRDVWDLPVLRRIVAKHSIEDWGSTSAGAPAPKLKDNHLEWQDAFTLILRRSLIGEVFDAFDTRKLGSVPLTGKDSEDLKETLDLAYTFLRFMASGGTQRQPGRQEEQSVPNIVVVKPGALYRVMGLVGDRWMPDGNADGRLDKDELFSVVQLYDEVQLMANLLVYSTRAPRYAAVAASGSEPLYDFRNMFFPRFSFIHTFVQDFEYYHPWMRDLLAQIAPEQRDSLLHGVIGINDGKPLDAQAIDYPSRRTMLKFYVDQDAPVAPSALLIALQKLMLKCDTDEDGSLSWTEMDCALPLALEGAYQTVASGLLDLDVGVHDGARFLLSFLQMPGLPLSITKLAAANGSVLRFRLSEQADRLENWAALEASVNWDGIGHLLANQKKLFDSRGLSPTRAAQGLGPIMSWLNRLDSPSLFALEARLLFGACDFSPADDKIQGEAEWRCFTDKAVGYLEWLAQRLLPGDVFATGRAQLRSIEQSKALRTGLILATQNEAQLQALMRQLPLRSSPAGILELMEEILRREVPVTEMKNPDES